LPDPDTAPRPLRHPIAADRLGASVWLTAQQNSRTQRTGRYLPESVAHPAKMLPEIARQAIARFTEPGDLVIDPMCGIGTTLVEAAHAGRRAIGVEYEPRWARIADMNLHHAYDQGATGAAHITHGDARNLLNLTPHHAHGTAALIITSPPYGASVHGQVRSTSETGQPGVHKFDHTYSHDRENLAHAGTDTLVEAFAAILAGCLDLLRPGGIVTVTARPWRERGTLIDLPERVLAAAAIAGLVPFQRCVALLAGIRDGQLIARPSFFQLTNVRHARNEGEPHSLIVHEDLLLFHKPIINTDSQISAQPRLPLLRPASQQATEPHL
jgi:SAM-dependent methyltransferase